MRPELGPGLLDHGGGLFEVGDVGAVGDGLAAGLADLFDHRQRGVGRAALAVAAAAEVVDHDLGAEARQFQRMHAAQAVAGTRHNGHTAVKANRHGITSKYWMMNGLRGR